MEYVYAKHDLYNVVLILISSLQIHKIWRTSEDGSPQSKETWNGHGSHIAAKRWKV